MPMAGGRCKSAVEGSPALTLGTASFYSLDWADPHWISSQNKMCKLVLNWLVYVFIPPIFPTSYPLQEDQILLHILFSFQASWSPLVLVFPLLLIFFTTSEITDHFLCLWAMFLPTPPCWRNVASKLCVFPRNVFLSAGWAVAPLPILGEGRAPCPAVPRG